MAAPTDSRLGPGTLKLATIDFGAQVSNAKLEPKTDSEDGTPTLGDPDPLPQTSESWELTGEAIQDWGNPDGFVNYCADHALESVAFEFIPDTPNGTKWTGTVQLTSLPIGGDVSKQNASQFTFAVAGTPVRVDAPGAAPAGKGKS